ncbi:nuclear transport factor 2 family protein [Kitasatospora sp. RG8]|uniref:nuclear transport factor 2 family protein n=1 Tax=Kitasatospora sp. RG8 TaxID=2820815 RepID=UPI001ADEC9BC|nr:nuclear transport factor 2 family protein [Kitasatospora sp. RG8]MBP0451727.1 nuclear transport factor 2 family protein [Kitasatospora sp. RG8]
MNAATATTTDPATTTAATTNDLATTTATDLAAARELVRDYLETVWNQGRTDLADRYLAEDLAQHNPNLPDGRAALTAFVDGLRAQLPELRFDLRRLAADGDLVFAHSLFTAAPGDDGRAVIDVFRLEGGLIAEHWDLNEAVPATTASGRPAV